jgi:hypothetical protein
MSAGEVIGNVGSIELLKFDIDGDETGDLTGGRSELGRVAQLIVGCHSFAPTSRSSELSTLGCGLQDSRVAMSSRALRTRFAGTRAVIEVMGATGVLYSGGTLRGGFARVVRFEPSVVEST